MVPRIPGAPKRKNSPQHPGDPLKGSLFSYKIESFISLWNPEGILRGLTWGCPQTKISQYPPLLTLGIPMVPFLESIGMMRRGPQASKARLPFLHLEVIESEA